MQEIPAGVAGIVVATVVAAPALATAWGLAWIAVGRTEGQFESPALVWAAGIAAAVVLLAPLLRRLRR